MRKCVALPMFAVACGMPVALILSSIFAPLLAHQLIAITSKATNCVIVSWPENGSYTLQTNYDLSKTNWGIFAGPITNRNGTNRITVDEAKGIEFFRLSPASASGFNGPTGIPGLAYYWNFNDLPIGGAVNCWTDRVSMVVLKSASSTNAPTNQNIGVFFNNQFNNGCLTNAAIRVGSNFSWWCVFRPNTNDYLGGYWTNNLNLFGSLSGYGISVTNIGDDGPGYIQGYWGPGAADYPTTVSMTPGSVLYPTAVDFDNPTPAITFDMVDSDGTFYTNGVAAASNIGQPTNNFPFQCVGSLTNINNAFGCIQYIGIWTNSVLTASDVSNLDVWVNTNGVSNVTGGLMAWYKLDEGSGTNIADSSGNGNDGYVFGNALWTNGVVGGGFSFDGNTKIITKNFADNIPDFSVTFWVNGNNFLNGSNAAAAHGATFVGKWGPPGGTWGPGDGTNRGIGWTVGSDNGTDCFPGLYGTNGFYEGGRPGVAQYDTNWHFIVCGFSNLTSAFTYLDGAYYEPTPYGGIPTGTANISNTNVVAVGGDGENEDVTANLDDIRIYNRILSPAEIAILYRWRGQP